MRTYFLVIPYHSNHKCILYWGKGELDSCYQCSHKSELSDSELKRFLAWQLRKVSSIRSIESPYTFCSELKIVVK